MVCWNLWITVWLRSDNLLLTTPCSSMIVEEQEAHLLVEMTRGMLCRVTKKQIIDS